MESSLFFRERPFDIERVSLRRGHGITSLSFSPNSRTLAATVATKEDKDPSFAVLFWDVSQDLPFRKRFRAKELVRGHCVCFASDGSSMAVADSGTLSVWNYQTRTLLFRTTGKGHQTTNMSFSPDGTVLGSIGPDGIGLFNIPARGQEQLAQDCNIDNSKYTHKGTNAINMAELKQFWFRPTKLSAVYKKMSNYRETICFASGKTKTSRGAVNIATLERNGSVKIWLLRLGMTRKPNLVRTIEPPQPLSHSKPRLACPCFSPDGLTLAVLTDGDVVFWNIQSGKKVFEIKVATRFDKKVEDILGSLSIPGLKKKVILPTSFCLLSDLLLRNAMAGPPESDDSESESETCIDSDGDTDQTSESEDVAEYWSSVLLTDPRLSLAHSNAKRSLEDPCSIC